MGYCNSNCLTVMRAMQPCFNPTVQAVERVARLKHSSTEYIIMTKSDATLSSDDDNIPLSTDELLSLKFRMIGLNESHCLANKQPPYAMVASCFICSSV
jgi:hypothetical protein